MVTLISGTSKGIGRFLAEYYLGKGDQVIGISRSGIDLKHQNYEHFTADVSNEQMIKNIMLKIRKKYGGLDHLINNAGLASMNHFLLTPTSTLEKLLMINAGGTFLLTREAVKLMKKKQYGRVVNFTTVAVPLSLEGEAAYVASKSAVEALTKVLAKEIADFGITVNAIGPVPLKTDLIKAVPQEKIELLLQKQAIKRYGEMSDIANVLDFFLAPQSSFITGQIVYLGGI